MHINKKIFFTVAFVLAVAIFVGYKWNSKVQNQKRWYTKQMVTNGKPLYENNCASCHGLNGEGTAKFWNKKMANGRYPPPPLNSEAHAYHHPLKALRFTIQNGGKYIGGVMPAFNQKLSYKETDEVIAYFQEFWGDKFYEEWLKRGGLKK